MKEDHIFLENVEIPEIVQKKADSAFLAIKTERNGKVEFMADQRRKRTVRTIAAAAACMAAVVSAGALGLFGEGQRGSAGTGAKDAVLTAVDKLDKMFTLQVKAAESEDGQFVPLAQGTPVAVAVGSEGKSWVIGEGETEGSVNYCIALPQITCEGEQIESITYSINHGAFQIVQPEGEESIIADGEPYAGEMNTGSIGGDYSEERNGEPSRPFETLFYQSFTLDYDRQSDESTWINLCNEREDSGEIIQLLWEGNGSEEEQCSGIQKMLDGTVLTCTVLYSDNSSRSVDIKVDARVMTRREAGEPAEEGFDPEEKMTVITFELQQ